MKPNSDEPLSDEEPDETMLAEVLRYLARRKHRPFVTWHELMATLHMLGYRKIPEPTDQGPK